MIYLFFGLAWTAVLIPFGVRIMRDNKTEKSIHNFHVEHEALTRQDYSVEPAHRLDREDATVLSSVKSLIRKPRLRVVHDEDTYQSLESESSWDEWNDDYGFQDEAPQIASAPSYASAYASAPRSEVNAPAPILQSRRRTARAQRRRIFFGTGGSAVLLSVLAYASGSSFLWDLAGLAWFAEVGFIALVFYSLSQGWLLESSLPIRIPNFSALKSRLPQRLPRLATINTIYDEAPTYEEEFDDEFYEPGTSTWAFAEQPRRAFG